MIRFLVQRPIGVTVSFFALLMFGITAYFKLPISLLPDIDAPEVIVRLNTGTYTVEDTEKQVVEPIRQVLLQLNGLDLIESKSADGYGLIHIRFKYGTNMSMAFVEVNEKVDLAMNRLPKEINRPVVSKMSVDDIPVFHLQVYRKNTQHDSISFLELSTFVREVVRRRIEQLPEVSMVDITGAAFPQIALVPNKNVLESLGLQPSFFQQIINDNQIEVSQVSVRDGHYRYFLKFSAGWHDEETIRDYPVNIAGRVLKIRDLAQLTYGVATPFGHYYSDEKAAMSVAVIKQTSARMEDLQQQIKHLLDDLRKNYPDIEFKISQDQTQLLDYALKNLRQDLFIGGSLAFLCIWLFIRRSKLALLIGITIPMSLLMSLLGFYLLDISLNIISLGGLILGLSLIVDNSIVVMDSISRFRSLGVSIARSAIQGTLEVIRPLIASVLTNCAVFIPLIFLSGLSGAVFFDQAVSIVIGVISSLIVAIILLPPLYCLLYKKVVPQVNETKPLINLTRLYDQGLKWSFKHPLILTFLSVSMFLSGWVWYALLDKKRLPDITANDTELHVAWNEPISLEENKRRVLTLENTFGEHSKEFNSWIGRQQYQLSLWPDQDAHESLIYIKCSSEAELQLLRQNIGVWFSHYFPQAIIEYKSAKNAFDQVFGYTNAALELQVSAARQRRAPAVDEMQFFVSNIEKSLPHVSIKPLALQEYIGLTIDPEACIRHQLSPSEVALAVEEAFGETVLEQLFGQESVSPLVLKPYDYGAVGTTLQHNFIRNKNGNRFPLALFASYKNVQDYRYVHSSVQGGYYPIQIETPYPDNDLSTLKTIIDNDQVNVVFRGSFFDNQLLLREMSMVLLISVFLLYFILAAQFESLLQPLFILAELPIAISGSLLLLYLGGSSLNIMSMIGIVVMSGLIINDSILKIDAINQLRHQGMSIKQAIYKGGHKRLNSILMITLTSIGALLPTLFMDDMGSEMQKPLILALLGGMLVGLLVSLFFVPLLYWALYRHSESNNNVKL